MQVSLENSYTCNPDTIQDVRKRHAFLESEFHPKVAFICRNPNKSKIFFFKFTHFFWTMPRLSSFEWRYANKRFVSNCRKQCCEVFSFGLLSSFVLNFVCIHICKFASTSFWWYLVSRQGTSNFFSTSAFLFVRRYCC